MNLLVMNFGGLGPSQERGGRREGLGRRQNRKR